MEGGHSSYEGIERIGQLTEAYPGIELANSKGDPREVEEKQTVALGNVQAEHEQKQFVSSKDNTETSMGLLKGGAHTHSEDLPPGSLLQVVPNRSRQAKWWKILGIVAVVIILVVSIPVGVIVSRNKRISTLTSSYATSSGATVSPTAVPTGNPAGVLNGTRLTTMDPRTGGDIHLYYQYGDRSLRYISQSPKRIWQGSTDLQVTDAMLGSPLATVSTSTKGSVLWWLFYVDESNIIQNVYSQSDPTTWQKGSVGSNGYKVPNQTNIAFTVSRGIKYNTSSNDLGGGLSLYASGTDGIIHEYIFNEQDGSWSDGFIFFNTDGFSGATVYSVTTNALFFALGNDQMMKFWWRNYNTSSSNHDNSWHLGQSSHDSVFQNVSMCAQYLIAFQGSSGMIQGSNFTSSADPAGTRWGVEYNISNQPAINGSAVSCWFFYPDRGTPDGLMFQVFYQVEGNQIAEARKNWGPGNHTLSANWTYGVVPIR